MYTQWFGSDNCNNKTVEQFATNLKNLETTVAQSKQEVESNEIERTKSIEEFFAENPEYFEEDYDKNDTSPLVIFVNGYWNLDLPFAGENWGEKYWGKDFKE